MKLLDRTEPSLRWPSLIAAALLCVAIALSCALTRSPASRGTPPGRAAPPASIARSPHTTDDRALRSDGHGGWYAIVEVAGGCEPAGTSMPLALYRLNLVGAAREARVRTFPAVGQTEWWIGDRFVAHLRSVPSAQRRGTAQLCIAGCDGSVRETEDLAVVGLVAIDRDDTATLAEVAAGRRSITEVSEYADGKALQREPERHVEIATVTPGRRWQVIDPRSLVALRAADASVLATLGPPPATATAGAHQAIVVSPGRPARAIGEIDDEREHELALFGLRASQGGCVFSLW